MVYRFIDEVKDVIESSLPASSAIVAKVVNIIYSQTSNARDVAEAIEHDPDLTANILKVANSAYYGSTTTINSLQRAVVILGFDTIKDIVSTLSLVKSFGNGYDNKENDLTGLWYHSIGTAKACQFISHKMYVERPDIAYIAGLLHDIGKIILVIYFPEQYREIRNLTEEKHTRIILAERKILNADHTMIGSLLCDMWSIPDNIGTAIMHHHDPSGGENGSQKLSRLVELGDYMCRKAEIGFPGDNVNKEPSISSLALLGPKHEVIEENFNVIFKELNDSKAEIDEFFRED